MFACFLRHDFFLLFSRAFGFLTTKAFCFFFLAIDLRNGVQNRFLRLFLGRVYPLQTAIDIYQTIQSSPPLRTPKSPNHHHSRRRFADHHPLLLMDERFPKTHRILHQDIHGPLPQCAHHPSNDQHPAIPLPIRNHAKKRSTRSRHSAASAATGRGKITGACSQ